MAHVSLRSNGQIVLPPEILQVLGARAGDPLDITVDAAGRVVLARSTRARVAALRGSLRSPENPAPYPTAIHERSVFEEAVARDNS